MANYKGYNSMSPTKLRKEIATYTKLADKYAKSYGSDNDYAVEARRMVSAAKGALAKKDKTEARVGEKGYNDLGNKNHQAPKPIKKKK